MSSQPPALRPYLESINQECQSLNRDQLIKTILAMAKQVEPDKRLGFLDNFRAMVLKFDTQVATAHKPDLVKLKGEIEELHQTIMARVISIDDGSYWDDPDDDDWEDFHYHDDGPEPVNDEQSAALHAFFLEADNCFISGEKSVAKLIYSALFALIEEMEEYGFSPELEINLRETHARMARCVYQLSTSEERLDAMLSVMKANQIENDFDDLNLRDLPLFQDILDAETEDLADFDSFLTTWQSALSLRPFQENRIADLMLEAVFLQNGSKAVGELARNWQNQQPRGYLYWLKQLKKEENWSELLEAGFETIKVLQNGTDRLQATEFLITAAKHLEDDASALTGYRERFRSSPADYTLLGLLTEAGRQQVREQELEKACTYCAESKSERDKKLLHVKALLMAGKFDQAFALGKQGKSGYWAYSSTDLLFASVLYLLSDGNVACTLLHQQMEDYANCQTFSFYGDTTHLDESTTSCFEEIKYGLNLIDPTTLDLDFYRKWSGAYGEELINDIVSNTNRSSYDKAAMVLGSLAETMAATGEKKKAQTLLHEYCKVLYSRHTAFRREVREAVGRSEILKGMDGRL